MKSTYLNIKNIHTDLYITLKSGLRSVAASLLLLSGLTFSSCVQAGLINENGKEDTINLLTQLLLALQPCSIGGYNFDISGPECTPGGATGSGTLQAQAPKSDFLSLTLAFQMHDQNSSIQIVMGGIPESNSTTANYFNITSSSTSLVGVTATPAGVAADTAYQSWCFETHFTENPDHMIFDNITCTNKSVSAALKDAEGTGVTRDTSGGTWGFVLNNASIHALTVNQSEVFSE